MLESKVQDLTRQLNEEKISSQGSQQTYVRWGKKICGTNSTLIYSGQAAGTSYAVTGGAANPLCMVHEVLWSNQQTEPSMSLLRGAEYQDNFWGAGSLDKDVPCAVCKPKHSTVLMVPGRNKCLPEWTEEYHDHLSSSYEGHAHTTTFVCVDENVDFLDSE
ncbi:uncharacterized protein LOC143051358 isoform X2 [Mytilus galloprovincialis]